MPKRTIFSFESITKYFRAAWLAIFFIGVAATTVMPVVQAQTCTTSWAMPVDGNWSDPTKWTNGVPVAGRDVACIGGGSFKVTVTGNQATQDLIVSSGPTVEILGHDVNAVFLVGHNYMNDGILQLDSLSTASAYLVMDQGGVGVLQNTGRIEVNASSTSLRQIQGIIINAGQISVNQDANFTGNGSSLTNSGTITVAAGKTLKVFEPVIQNDGGIEPYGTFEVRGPSFIFNGGRIDGTPEGGVVLRDVFTLQADGIGSGPLSVRGIGYLMGNVGHDVVLLIQADQTSGNAALQTRGDLINDGTIVLATADNSGYTSQLSVNGTLTNRNSILVASPNPGEHRIDAQAIVNGVDGNPSATITIDRDANFYVGGGSTSFTNLSTIEITPAATLTLWGTRATLYNPSQGTIRGGGTLKLQGATNFSGVGFADINLINHSGTVHPGDALGAIELSGDFMADTGTLSIDLQGTTPGQDYSQLIVDGNAQLSGVLALNRVSGYVPDPGDSFTVMTYGSHTGSFSFVNGLTICPTLSFQVSYTDTSVVATAVGTPCE